MAKKILLAMGLLLVLIVISLGTISASKRQALSDVAGTTLLSNAHHLRVVQCGKLALDAEFNYGVITRAAEYVGSLGSSTGVYMGIAKIASEAGHEVPELAEVLDLAVLKQSESQQVLDLARQAVAMETPAARTIWRARHAALLATATYPDLKTALAAMKVD